MRRPQPSGRGGIFLSLARIAGEWHHGQQGRNVLLLKGDLPQRRILHSRHPAYRLPQPLLSVQAFEGVLLRQTQHTIVYQMIPMTVHRSHQ